MRAQKYPLSSGSNPRLLWLLGWMGLAGWSAVAAAEASPTELTAPGVSKTLATERARLVSDLRYALHLTVPEDPGDPIHGQEIVRCRWGNHRAHGA